VPTGPDQLWAADITYVATAAGWVYVAAILDLYSRRIGGWAVSQKIDTTLVLMALSIVTGRMKTSHSWAIQNQPL
jgi:transposase InsO family protein